MLYVALVSDDNRKLSDSFDASWIPLMRIFCLTQRGQEKGRSHLIIVRHMAVDSLMNQTTSKVDYICMMTSPKVSAPFSFLCCEVILMSELCSD